MLLANYLPRNPLCNQHSLQRLVFLPLHPLLLKLLHQAGDAEVEGGIRDENSGLAIVT